VNLSRNARIVLGVFLAFLLVLSVVMTIAIIRFQPVARQYAISALREQYHSDVQLGDLRISLFPRVKATGENLVFRLEGRQGGPPLLTIRRFTIEARLIGFFRTPKHIRLLHLEGLEIHVPPHGQSSEGQATVEKSSGGSSGSARVPLIFEEVVANGMKLQTLPSNPSKDPLDFDISELTLHHVGLGQPMTYHAKLMNPKPPGFIHTDGRFGPWRREDPSQTPVSGSYTFRDADLSVFHGISGTLASNGNYQGRLDRIKVQGTADVPNFALTSARQPMPLHTTFKATVDGTDGDTVLHPVRALLGHSAFDVSGAIERHALEKHKTISLEAKGNGDLIQDFLRLAVKGKSPMAGGISFQSRVVIPPGESDVLARLRLNGSFGMTDIRFTSEDVMRKLANLSNHALGKPKAPDTEPVSAQLTGGFRMDAGAITLPHLAFAIPGAQITLRGSYKVASGAIDMRGDAKLQATISQMTTGVKRIFLKPVDPLFRRDSAGAVLPIKIGGTRGDPSFKLDIGRVLKRD
jgi:hypothetical protein